MKFLSEGQYFCIDRGLPVKEANHQDQKRFSYGVLNNKFIKIFNRNWVGQAPGQCLYKIKKMVAIE